MQEQEQTNDSTLNEVIKEVTDENTSTSVVEEVAQEQVEPIDAADDATPEAQADPAE